MSLSLEDIYIKYGNRTSAARLRATLVAYADKSLKQEDRKYVEDDIFPILYLYSDVKMLNISVENDITPDADRIKLIRSIIRKYNSYDKDFIMINASRYGHMEIVELMLDKGADNYDEAMANAASGGHMEIVELMLRLGATDYNWAMTAAASGGHMEIVQLMLQKGATNYDEAIKIADEAIKRADEIRDFFTKTPGPRHIYTTHMM